MPLSSSGSYEGPVVFAGYGITSEAFSGTTMPALTSRERLFSSSATIPRKPNPRADSLTQESRRTLDLHQ